MDCMQTLHARPCIPNLCPTLPHFHPFPPFFLQPSPSITTPLRVPGALKTTFSHLLGVVYHHFPTQFSKNDTYSPIFPHFLYFPIFRNSHPASFQ